MSEPLTINPRIVEGLYCEALVLADEVRSAFTMPEAANESGLDEDLVRVAMSCEALKTTTRMMHCIAWLLNHRAYCMGELSEFQLMRYGRLPSDTQSSDAEQLALLEPATRRLVRTTERFHARLKRLDKTWRQRDPNMPSAIASLRARVERRMGQEARP
ncbi:MAG: DUF1465 family protein [Novosphingobium sp.]|nr:DUF1465 family protein [Novosphingobium sp.]